MVRMWVSVNAKLWVGMRGEKAQVKVTVKPKAKAMAEVH